MDWSKFLGKNWRKIVLFLCDALGFMAIAVFGLGVTHLVDVFPKIAMENYWKGALILFVILFVTRWLWGVYDMVWRFTSTKANLYIVLSDLSTTIVTVLLFALLGLSSEDWAYGLIVALNALFSLSIRFVYRLLYKRKHVQNAKPTAGLNVAIVGAEQLGILLLNELKCNPKSQSNPVLFIDKDQTKIGGEIAGVPVFDEADAGGIIDKYNVAEIIIALPDLSSEELNRLYQYYAGFGCKVKVYDTPAFESGDPNEAKKRIVREFQIEDLLCRNPLSINDEESFRYYTDKTVLVTGGGGSIGSELCRQVAKCHPKRLIIFDIYENNAYDIQQELTRKYGADLDLRVEIGSVRDRARLECIFANYRPQVVFHAAAHKHVPLMEQSGCEAIKNNVIGTYNTADMAEKYGVEKFILVSTDKAVNPTNIMGASKRLCEMVIQCRTDSRTNFAAVRFGNVLGSNGSVIPLFKKQIAMGGPITITDKRIIRYFMTIPEASQLVMQAGAMAQKGELFVLDMGKPVKIYDLAVNMIKLSGYKPNEDIEIKEIGLRPGEKLYEELLMTTEKMEKTENDMIFIEKDAPLTRLQVESKLNALLDAVEASKMELGSKRLIEVMQAVVPTYKDPNSVNEKAAESMEMKQAEIA
ncbi:MAG: polysaccharide biosynthesis protein [Clostridiales bacterium]|nr:polysaccharide biosynthesis protein [Clostridiales bacterium]